jgi:hypothetical protein
MVRSACVWKALGLDPANTLHDVRWGDIYDGQFVWVFEISGSVPPSHFVDGYASAEGWRQGNVFFPAGGSTIRGVSKPGWIVWSRIYIAEHILHADLGLGQAIELPTEETERRWAATNPEWPIMLCSPALVVTNSWPATRQTTSTWPMYRMPRRHVVPLT